MNEAAHTASGQGQAPLQVRGFRDDDRPRWDAFVNQSSASSFYHLAGWKDVVEGSFGHRTHYLLCEDGQGAIVGVLPMVHLKSALFGSFLVSMPYFNYGGVCAESDAAVRMLVEEAIRLAKEEGVAHLELRETRALDNDLGLAVKSAKVSMWLSLPASAEALWKALGSKLRNQVNRPKKEGMTARVGGAEELDSFYEVFSLNMRDLGTPVYSKAFFRNILEAFPDSTRIATVYRGSEPAAAGFLVGFRDRLEIPWASSLRAFNKYSPNMLLYWSVLEHACERGYGVFDFGRSSPDAGTYRFKEQWGATPVPLHWHYWTKTGGALPELNPNNPKYKAAIEVWRRLPVAMTRLIGPSIVKNLP